MATNGCPRLLCEAEVVEFGGGERADQDVDPYFFSAVISSSCPGTGRVKNRLIAFEGEATG
jgi:hypothetical protein